MDLIATSLAKGRTAEEPNEAYRREAKITWRTKPWLRWVALLMVAGAAAMPWVLEGGANDEREYLYEQRVHVLFLDANAQQHYESAAWAGLGAEALDALSQRALAQAGMARGASPDDSRGAHEPSEPSDGAGGVGAASRTAVSSDPIATFSAGYRDYGGREEWLTIFIAMGSGEWMNPICPGGESRGLLTPWHYGDSYHLSALQFAPSSWATAAAVTGLADAQDLYHVGANVAAWSKLTDPGGSGGWACWPN